MIEFEKRKVVLHIKKKINNANLFHFYLKCFITDYNFLADRRFKLLWILSLFLKIELEFRE